MLVFDERWQRATSQITIAIPLRGLVQVQVSGEAQVQMQGLRGQEKVPLKVGQEWRVRLKADDFNAITLKSSKPFGYSHQVIELQDGEPLNDEDPPAPPLPGADNLVAQFHRLVRDNARLGAGPYMDPEDLGPLASRYEIDEDDQRFEEEIVSDLQQKREERKRKKAEEKAQAQPHSAAEPQPGAEGTPSMVTSEGKEPFASPGAQEGAE